MSHKQFIKDVVIIGSTQILINLSSFILLPIITKTLGAFDYGIWSQLTVTISLLTSLAILGLSIAFIRFFSSKTDKKEISKGFFSIFFFITILALIIISILVVFSKPVSLFLFKTSIYAPLIQITSFLIILNALFTMVISYFRIYRQMFIYAFLIIFASVGQITLAIFLLVFLGYGIYGIVFSALFSYFVPLVIALGLIIKQIGFYFPSFSEMPQYLRYSLPLAPTSLFLWITSSSDRYIIGFLLGTSDVGVYSAAYGIGSLVFLLVSPLQIILFPHLSKLFDAGQFSIGKSYLSYSVKFFLLISLPAVVGLTVLSKPILVLLTSSEFAIGYLVIPFIALSAVFNGIFYIVSNITFYYKETKFIFYIILVSSLINISINIIFIPMVGYIAAAISTLLSYLIMFLLCYYKTAKYIKLNLDFISIFKIIVSSIFMGIILYFIPLRNLFYAIILGIVIYFIFILLLKTFKREEIKYFISFFKKNKTQI